MLQTGASENHLVIQLLSLEYDPQICVTKSTLQINRSLVSVKSIKYREYRAQTLLTFKDIKKF